MFSGLNYTAHLARSNILIMFTTRNAFCDIVAISVQGKHKPTLYELEKSLKNTHIP